MTTNTFTVTSIRGQPVEKRLLGQLKTQEFYSEDQIRDYHGRWAKQYASVGDLHISESSADDEGEGWTWYYGSDKESGRSRVRMLLSPEGDKTAVRLIQVMMGDEGKGYGTIMLNHAVEIAKDRGSTALISDPEGGIKPAAESLFKKLGAKKVGLKTAKDGYIYELDLAQEGVNSSPMTEFDRRVADYKPDRSLADPTKTVALTKLVPGVKFTPYSKTPFFRDINILQGMGDNPLKYGVAEYIKARDEVFNTTPVTTVSLDHVVVTQQMVNEKRVQEIIDDPSTGGTKPIQAVRYNNETYILNGHHRIAAELKRGTKEIGAHVLDLDVPDPAPPQNNSDIPRYIHEIHRLPSYKSVVHRLAALGATNDEREGYTLKQQTGPDGKLTPKAAAEHDRIVSQMFNPKAVAAKGKKPIAIFLIGKPAAGKTSAARTRLKEFPPLTTINCDDARGHLASYRGWNAATTQSESKLIVKELGVRALRARHNIMYDETAGNMVKTLEKAKAIAALGYEIHVIHVNAPMSQTLKVAWDRFKHEGRFVDPTYQLDDVDDKPIKAYEALKELPETKSWESIDNTNFQRKVVEQGSR